MFQVSLISVTFLMAYLGVFVWRARPDAPLHRSFGIFSIAIAGWSVAITGLETGQYLEFWARLSFASACVIPIAFFSVAYYYPPQSNWAPRLLAPLMVASATVLSFIALGTSFIVYDAAQTTSGFSRKTGPLYPVFAIYFIAIPLCGVVELWLKWRRSKGLERARLTYLGTGVVAAFVGATTTNLLIPLWTGHSPYSWAG